MTQSRIMVTLQSQKNMFFYGHQYFYFIFLFKYMPFGSMNMLFILQILHFKFFALLVLLFCPLRSIFMRFLGSSSFFSNIFKKFQRIIIFRRKQFWKMLAISVYIKFWILTKKKGGKFYFPKIGIFRGIIRNYVTKNNFFHFFSWI